MKEFIKRNKFWIYGIVLVCLGSCAFSVAPTSSQDRTLTLELDSFPGEISVGDSLAMAEIWATIKQGGKPVKDSTIVAFASTVGEITPFSFTTDGLAVAVLTVSGPGENLPPEGLIVAQVMAVRDSLFVNFIAKE